MSFFLYVPGYACRLLTAKMKLLICGEETLDVSYEVLTSSLSFFHAETDCFHWFVYLGECLRSPTLRYLFLFSTVFLGPLQNSHLKVWTYSLCFIIMVWSFPLVSLSGNARMVEWASYKHRPRSIDEKIASREGRNTLLAAWLRCVST